MDRCFLSKIVFMAVCFTGFSAMANCPLGDFFEKKQNYDRMLIAWQVCATEYNDDISQYKLAEAYEKGRYNLPKDEEQMFYFYQLAAESGHAEAQTHLAELFTTYDKTTTQREKLLNYKKKLKAKTEDTKGFKGDFMHPYALLMLASESPDKKWYYPSSERLAPARAISLLKAYKISEERKKKALLEASRWKSRKLLETAKEVVPEAKFDTLVKQLKNASTQAQAMQELKQYMDTYVQKKKALGKSK